MQTRLWGSYEGEIYSCQPKIKGDRKNIIRYTCLVHFDDGVKIIPNVRQSSVVGGIADYYRRRAVATNDDSDSTQAADDTSQPGLDATVGERVIIQFLNGNISNPVITGYLQHENQGVESELDAPDPEVGAVFQYQGVRIEVSSEGELRVIHKGAPEVSFAPQGSPAAAGAINALSSISPIGGNNSPAIKPAPETEITLFEFLNGGVFRLRDQEGQVIEVDRTNKTILISNNNLASTDVKFIGLEDNAEYVKFDKDSKELTVSARDSLVLNSDGTRDDTITSDYSLSVDRDMTTEVLGDMTDTVKGQLDQSVQRSWTMNVNGDISISGKTGVEVKDGQSGALVIKGGKVSLAGAAGELLDLFNQTLTQMIKAYQDLIDATQQNYGNLGLINIVNPTLVANYTQIISQLTEIQTTLGLITA